MKKVKSQLRGEINMAVHIPKLEFAIQDEKGTISEFQLSLQNKALELKTIKGSITLKQLAQVMGTKTNAFDYQFERFSPFKFEKKVIEEIDEIQSEYLYQIEIVKLNVDVIYSEKIDLLTVYSKDLTLVEEFTIFLPDLLNIFAMEGLAEKINHVKFDYIPQTEEQLKILTVEDINNMQLEELQNRGFEIPPKFVKTVKTLETKLILS